MFRNSMMAIAALAMVPVAAAAQDGGAAAQAADAPGPLADKSLVVYIKSDETRQIGLGLFTARLAARAGATVTVILGADGTEFALKQGKQEKFIATEETPRDMISQVVEVGGSVYVCALCATTQGYEQDDFIEGATIVTMREIFQVLFAEDAKSLEF